MLCCVATRCAVVHQGGPHDHTIAAIATTLLDAATPEFKAYIQQVGLSVEQARNIVGVVAKRKASKSAAEPRCRMPCCCCNSCCCRVLLLQRAVLHFVATGEEELCGDGCAADAPRVQACDQWHRKSLAPVGPPPAGPTWSSRCLGTAPSAAPCSLHDTRSTRCLRRVQPSSTQHHHSC
jgi:hypothetical protein